MLKCKAVQDDLSLHCNRDDVLYTLGTVRTKADPSTIHWSSLSTCSLKLLSLVMWSALHIPGWYPLCKFLYVCHCSTVYYYYLSLLKTSFPNCFVHGYILSIMQMNMDSSLWILPCWIQLSLPFPTALWLWPHSTTSGSEVACGNLNSCLCNRFLIYWAISLGHLESLYKSQRT